MEGFGNRRLQYLIVSCLSLGAVTFGCYASWLAPVMPKFSENSTNFYVSKDEMAWMAAASSPGFMVGSLISRFMSDRFGRRTTALGSALPAAVGTIIITFAMKAWLMYCAKFLWGLATGMFNVAISIYAAEIAEKEIRGALSLVSRFMFNFGNLLMMTIGPFVTYDVLNYIILGMPLVYFAACFWIPESPYYLLKEGKAQTAKDVMVKLRGYKDEKLVEDELLRMQSEVRNDMRRSTTAKELFTGKQYRKAVIIAFGLKLAQIMTGQLVIQQYLGMIMKESNTMDVTAALIIFGVVRFIVAVISSLLADKVGRRPLLIYSYFGNFVALFFVGLYFFLLEGISIDRDKLAPYDFVVFAGILLSNIISTLGYQSIIVVVPAEIFPLNVKAVAMTSISIFGALLNFFVARGYQIVHDATGYCGIFWIFAAISLGGAVFSVAMVRETKGKSFKEIQMDLQGSLYEDDEVFNKLNNVDNEVIIEGKELKEINKETKLL